MDYYPHVKSEEIPTLMNRRYDYLILDMGSQNEADLSEFLRCNRKLVLGSLAPWKVQSYLAFFDQFHHICNVRKDFCYFSQWGSEKDNRTFSKAHHISMQNIPFIRNPFCIEKQLFLFFDGLLIER